MCIITKVNKYNIIAGIVIQVRALTRKTDVANTVAGSDILLLLISNKSYTVHMKLISLSRAQFKS